MTRRALALVALVAGCGDGRADDQGKAAAAIARRPIGPLRKVAAEELCVTKGAVRPARAAGSINVADPVVRGTVPGSSGESARLTFTYRGHTMDDVELASGQIRRQVGLKLRAADGCNLVYAMWRHEPKPGLEVSVKRNPGQRWHKDCGTRGYRKVKPRTQVPLPPLVADDRHTMHASIEGDVLTVQIDGRLAWQGSLGPDVADLAGPAGFRTDNVEVDLELEVDGGAGGRADPATCANHDEG